MSGCGDGDKGLKMKREGSYMFHKPGSLMTPAYSTRSLKGVEAKPEEERERRRKGLERGAPDARQIFIMWLQIRFAGMPGALHPVFLATSEQTL